MRPLELFVVLAVALFVLALPELPQLARVIAKKRPAGRHEAENRRYLRTALRVVSWLGILLLLAYLVARA